MPGGPIRVRIAVQWGRRTFVTEADVLGDVQIAEDTFGSRVQLFGWFTHDSTKLSDGIGDVRTSVAGTIKECTYNALVSLQEFRVYGAGVDEGSCFDNLTEFGFVRDEVGVVASFWNALREISGDHPFDVARLGEFHVPPGVGEIDAQ